MNMKCVNKIVKFEKGGSSFVLSVSKGDYEGHPFRGNQYTSGSGAGEKGKGTSDRDLRNARIDATRKFAAWVRAHLEYMKNPSQELKEDTDRKHEIWVEANDRHEAIRDKRSQKSNMVKFFVG
jgi:hypothetical protein